MAEVYLARRRAGGVEKRLVIKRLRRDRHRDPRFLDLFIREAQLSMSLVQQNIVPVFDFGRIGEHVFLAMEYIDGKDLGSSLAVARGAGMPPVLAAYVAAECCQALDHAHRRKEPVIHRDVTPRNVLLSWDGEVKLADFGIAAVVGEAGNALGTPGYMAPEQANGERVDARADVYALGLVLWESLTGAHVRPAGDPVAALAIARTGELPELPAAPPALVAILRRTTAHDPAQRFATAREMADELDAFIVAERARESGAPPGKRLADWLAERWGSAREKAAGGELPAGAAIVTFLDDGEDGVRGTHTARSNAETAADEPPALEPSGASPARRLLPSDAHPVVASAPPGQRAGTEAGRGSAEGERQRRIPTDLAWQTGLGRRRWAIGALALALAGAAIAIYVVTRDRGGSTREARPAVAIAPDAAVLLDAPPDLSAPPPPAPLEPIDAPSPADAPARPADVIVRVRPRPELPARKEAGPLRPIWINALPWAYFTVDDDPKQHETPAMVSLSIGAHRVTFTNPQLGVSRTVTVTVPTGGEVRHVEKMN